MLVAVPLGTFPTELTTALALAAAVLLGDRRRLSEGLLPLSGLVLAFALVAPGHGWTAWREVLGRAWPLLPLALAPALARHRSAPVEAWALRAASLVAALAVVQRLWTGDPTAMGPFSHHLTLGYALVPPLTVAAHRRAWGPAAALLAGVVASGGSGPMLAAAIALLGALALPPLAALGAGLLATLALVRALAGDSELHQRAVLWASGAWLAVDRPLGVGPAEAREGLAAAQHLLEPGFHFPVHAHDSALQLGALVGMGGWIALAWLAVWAWQRADRPGRAMLAALAVGSLTQDVLGDLEVARAAAVWLGWCALAPEPPAADAVPSSADRRPA